MTDDVKQPGVPPGLPPEVAAAPHLLLMSTGYKV